MTTAVGAMGSPVVGLALWLLDRLQESPPDRSVINPKTAVQNPTPIQAKRIPKTIKSSDVDQSPA
jgi:hypothetical protein